MKNRIDLLSVLQLVLLLFIVKNPGYASDAVSTELYFDDWSSTYYYHDYHEIICLESNTSCNRILIKNNKFCSGIDSLLNSKKRIKVNMQDIVSTDYKLVVILNKTEKSDTIAFDRSLDHMILNSESYQCDKELLEMVMTKLPKVDYELILEDLIERKE